MKIIIQEREIRRGEVRSLKAPRGIFFVLFGLSLSFILCSCAFGRDIAIYGDSQNYPDVQSRIVQEVSSFKPAAVFRTGDLVDDGYNAQLWNKFKEVEKPLLETTEYFPVLGNHEYYYHDFPAQLYFDNFPSLKKLNRKDQPRWYSVDREGIHFIVLDSNSNLAPESEQYKWLEDDLAHVAKDVKFKIAIFHHPVFDVGKNHPADEKKIGPILLPLFEKYGISAVFSGHSHNYQRFERNGIYFVVTSGGGSILHPQQGTDPYLQKFIMAYHFCLLNIENGALRIRVIDVNLNIIDDFKITAGNEARNKADSPVGVSI